MLDLVEEGMIIPQNQMSVPLKLLIQLQEQVAQLMLHTQPDSPPDMRETGALPKTSRGGLSGGLDKTSKNHFLAMAVA